MWKTGLRRFERIKLSFYAALNDRNALAVRFVMFVIILHS